jgi:hypothetical protein
MTRFVGYLAVSVWLLILAFTGPAALLGGCLDGPEPACDARYQVYAIVWIALAIVTVLGLIWKFLPRKTPKS